MMSAGTEDDETAIARARADAMLAKTAVTTLSQCCDESAVVL